jgi:hypothetical protein
MVLEILNGALMLLGLIARIERSQIATLASLWIQFPGIESVLARLEFADHEFLPNAESVLKESNISYSNSQANRVACRLLWAFSGRIEIRVIQRVNHVIPH